MSDRRIYTGEEKAQIIEEVKNSGSMNAVAKKNNISVSTIHNWVKGKNKSATKTKKINAEFKKLKSKYDDAILENKILKELLKKTYTIWDID